MQLDSSEFALETTTLSLIATLVSNGKGNRQHPKIKETCFKPYYESILDRILTK